MKYDISVIFLAKQYSPQIDFYLEKQSHLFAQTILIDNTRHHEFTKTSKKNKKIVNKNIKLIHQPTKITSFANIRNKAIEIATQKWILFLDSDEILSPDLMKTIHFFFSKKKENLPSAFAIKRIDFFKNKPLRYGEVGNVYKIRLACKNSIHFSRPIHEIAHVQGKVKKMKQPIWHYPHQSVTSFFEKICQYAQLDAEWKHANNISFSYISLVLKPILKFVWNYFGKAGFLDGYRGLIYASMMSIHSLIVRVRLYELQYFSSSSNFKNNIYDKQ